MGDTSTAVKPSLLDQLIIDPPATGLTEGVRKAISDLAPETLIYVSCNPPTLARDLKELQQKFAINSITPLDMFPQTAEIEVVAHLEQIGVSSAETKSVTARLRAKQIPDH